MPLRLLFVRVLHRLLKRSGADKFGVAGMKRAYRYAYGASKTNEKSKRPFRVRKVLIGKKGSSRSKDRIDRGVVEEVIHEFLAAEKGKSSRVL